MNQKQQHEPINDVQRLYFELLQRVHYNLLDGEIEVLLPEDIELINANLSDAHNRVLFVWWD